MVWSWGGSQNCMLQGDAFVMAFHDPRDAVSWAVVAQQVGCVGSQLDIMAHTCLPTHRMLASAWHFFFMTAVLSLARLCEVPGSIAEHCVPSLSAHMAIALAITKALIKPGRCLSGSVDSRVASSPGLPPQVLHPASRRAGRCVPRASCAWIWLSHCKSLEVHRL